VSELVFDEPQNAIAVQPTATNPLMLLERAVEKGMSPEQLRALVDLHEQWRAARAREAFMAALNSCQAEMPVMVRDGENKHTQSRYAKLDGIVHAAKPIYTSNGFALSFSEDDSKKEGFKRIVCDIVHREGHSERRWLDLPIDGTGAKGGKSSMNEVQGCISTGSYGQRVLLCRIFNITIADTDLDGQTLHPNPAPDPAAPQEQPRAKRTAKEGQSPTDITENQLAHLVANWKSQNPDPDGNLVRQSAVYKDWVIRVTERTFNPRLLSMWRKPDYAKCCSALAIEEGQP
jgi:hypothetical protein